MQNPVVQNSNPGANNNAKGNEEIAPRLNTNPEVLKTETSALIDNGKMDSARNTPGANPLTNLVPQLNGNTEKKNKEQPTKPNDIAITVKTDEGKSPKKEKGSESPKKKASKKKKEDNINPKQAEKEDAAHKKFFGLHDDRDSCLLNVIRVFIGIILLPFLLAPLTISYICKFSEKLNCGQCTERELGRILRSLWPF